MNKENAYEVITNELNLYIGKTISYGVIYRYRWLGDEIYEIAKLNSGYSSKDLEKFYNQLKLMNLKEYDRFGGFIVFTDGTWLSTIILDERDEVYWSLYSIPKEDSIDHIQIFPERDYRECVDEVEDDE
jgi:hypothetical protein